MFSHFDTIAACDRKISCHSIVRAYKSAFASQLDDAIPHYHTTATAGEVFSRYITV